MYIKSICFKNMGPLEDVKYSFPFENGSPLPVILTGINGSGKTLILVNILNGYVNLKNRSFDDIPETDSKKYYKILTNSYTNNSFSYFNIEFTNAFYSDLSVRNIDSFKKLDIIFPHINVKKINERRIIMIMIQRSVDMFLE